MSNLKSKISKPQLLKVLTVEDSEDDVLLIIRELKKGGYDPVYERVETEKAMKKALKEKPWDVILCDYKLPKFNGAKAIALLKGTNVDIPLIIVSGTIGEDTAVECMRLGAQDYIMKNNLLRLCPAIARELEEAKIRNKHKQAESQKKAALEELRKSEESFRLSLDDSPLGVRIVTAEGETLYLNQATLEIYGYDSIEELKRTPLKERYTPESYAEFQIRNGKRGRGEFSPSEYEISIVKKNGEVRHVQVFRKEVWWNGERQFQVIYQDITERKQAEKSLFIIKSAVESASDAIGMSDPQGHHFYQNKSFTNLFEYTAEELEATGGGPAAFSRSDTAREVFDAIMNGRSWSGETEMISKSGRRFPVLLRANAIKDNVGKVISVLGTFTDITERKQAEEALRKSEENFRRSLDDSPLGIHIVTVEGETLYVNQAALDIYGFASIEELRGTPVEKRYTPESYAEFQIRKEKKERGEFGPSEYEINIVRKNGEIRHVQVFRKEVIWNGERQFQVIYQDITDRKQAEESLRESEEKYKSLVNNVPDIIFAIDLEGKITFVSQRWKEILGYESAETINMNILNFIPEEDRQRAMESMQKGLKGEKIRSFQIPIITKSREKLFFECSFSRIYKDKAVVGAQGTAVDITERKKLQETLNREREDLKIIIDSSPIIIFYKDKEGRFLRGNRTFAAALNMPEENFVGKTVFDIYSPHIAQSMTDDDQDVFQSQRSKLNIIEQYEAASGIRWVQTDKIPIFDKDGILMGLVGFSQDITEHKRAEETLRESEEKYRNILENIEEAYYEVDFAGNFTFFNDSLCQIIGYHREELMGLNYRQYTDEYTAKKVLQAFNEVYRTEKPRAIYDYEIIRKDGTKYYIAASISLLKDSADKATGFRGIMRDVTERKRAEEKLLQSEEKYRSIVENAQEGIYQSTPEGRYLTLNFAVAKMLGYESPEEVMQTITDMAKQLYVNQADRKKLLKTVNEKGSVAHFETEFYKKDGGRIWVSINMHAVRDDEGRLLYYQGIAQDITERKKIESERQENIERLRKSLGATINAMAVTVETRDPYTAGHQRRVADLARAIATEMNLKSEQLDSVRMASMIHDIGKISIPSEILTKPTHLTDLEFNLIKTHPASGYNILKDIEFPWPIARIVLEHHERLNGSGYPNGLKGEQILLESKIISVADVVEAMASHRPYRAAQGIEVALDEITKNKGILYEPDIIDACLRLFREKNYNLVA